MITSAFGTAIIAPRGGYYMDFDKYMSSLEAQEIWGVSSSWVRRLCARGELKCIRIRNVWFIERDQPNPKKERESE
jgi:hypothetical protein